MKSILLFFSFFIFTEMSLGQSNFNWPSSNPEKDKADGCNSAMDAWDEKYKAINQLCQNLNKSSVSGETCSAKVESCKSKVSTSIGVEKTSKDQSIEDLISVITDGYQANTKKTLSNAPATENAACYGLVNDKISTKQEKRETKIADLEKQITAEKKTIDEKNADLRKQEIEIKNDQQKITAELKKKNAELDKQKQEKYNDLNKEIQQAATNIRNLNSKIIEQKRVIEKINFDHQAAMLNYTKNKISERCKSTLATAKQCMVRASQGIKSTEADSCKGLEFSGSGTKGTAELKNKLVQINDACFQQENLTSSRMQYDTADKIRTANTTIQELTAQVNDANKALELSKSNMTTVAKQFDDEIAREKTDAQEQVNNLTQKLAALTQSTQEAVNTSNTLIKNLNAKIDQLSAVKLLDDVGMDGSSDMSQQDKKFYYSQVDEAISSEKKTYAVAFDRCSCAPPPEDSSKDSNGNSTPTTKKASISASCSTLIADHGRLSTVIQTSTKDKKSSPKRNSKTKVETSN